MLYQIVNGRIECANTVLQHADSSVAVIAQKPTNTSREMAVIYRELQWLAVSFRVLRFVFPTNRAGIRLLL